MNQEQIFSLVRIVLMMGGTSLVTRGFVQAEELPGLIDKLMIALGALGAIGAAVYGVWKRRPTGLIKSAANQPEVAKIVTDSATAAAVPSVKVVPPSVI